MGFTRCKLPLAFHVHLAADMIQSRIELKRLEPDVVIARMMLFDHSSCKRYGEEIGKTAAANSEVEAVSSSGTESGTEIPPP